MMKKIILNNKETIPAIGLGTWLSQAGEVESIVKAAIEMGYRHIDCAACYGNEVEVGNAIEYCLQKNIVKREELFITSKLWNNSHAAKNVKPAFEKTLKDLKLTYLDLYLIHWPIAFKEDCFFPNTPQDYIPLTNLPIIETYSAMEELVQSGLVKSIGVSNFSIKKIKDLLSLAKIKPVINQVELHPYLQQNELLKFCQQNEIYLTGYSPLGTSGRPQSMLAANEPYLLGDHYLISLSSKYQRTVSQILLNWAVARGTIVIPKTVTPSRAKENFTALDFKIEEQDFFGINQLERKFRYVNGSFFTPEGSSYSLSNLWDE